MSCSATYITRNGNIEQPIGFLVSGQQDVGSWVTVFWPLCRCLGEKNEVVCVITSDQTLQDCLSRIRAFSGTGRGCELNLNVLSAPLLINLLFLLTQRILEESVLRFKMAHGELGMSRRTLCSYHAFACSWENAPETASRARSSFLVIVWNGQKGRHTCLFYGARDIPLVCRLLILFHFINGISVSES